jgi:hypothetical protein
VVFSKKCAAEDQLPTRLSAQETGKPQSLRACYLASASCLQKTGSETGFQDYLKDKSWTEKPNSVWRRETGPETDFKAGQVLA